MKNLNQEVWDIFSDCLAEQNRSYKKEYNDVNVLGEAKINDYVFSREKIENNKEKLIGIANILGINKLDDVDYMDLQYDKNNQSWTDYQQRLEMLVSLFDAAGIINVDKSVDFDNPRINIIYEFSDTNSSNVSDVIDAFPSIDDEGNVKYVGENDLLAKIEANRREIQNIIGDIKGNNPLDYQNDKEKILKRVH